MKKLSFAIIMAMSFVGLLAFQNCGGGGGGSSGATAAAVNKSVFSKWTASTGSFVDLTGGQFNQTQNLNLVYSGGAQCSCQFEAIGTETSGTFSILNCTYTSGGSGKDPGCGTLNEIGSYTKPASQLSACSGSPSVCTTYN